MKKWKDAIRKDPNEQEFLIDKFNELFYCKDGGYRKFEQEYKFLTEEEYNKLFLKD